MYYVTRVGMSPLELVLVGTVMELTVFCFEVPTGIVADMVSRRLSIVIGNAAIGLSFLLVGSVATVVPILFAQVAWGVGWTFTSGAMDAWLANEVGTEPIARVYLRGAQIGRVSSSPGSA